MITTQRKGKCQRHAITQYKCQRVAAKRIVLPMGNIYVCKKCYETLKEYSREQGED